jgi:hypothetical protein
MTSPHHGTQLIVGRAIRVMISMSVGKAVTTVMISLHHILSCVAARNCVIKVSTSLHYNGNLSGSGKRSNCSKDITTSH